MTDPVGVVRVLCFERYACAAPRTTSRFTYERITATRLAATRSGACSRSNRTASAARHRSRNCETCARISNTQVSEYRDLWHPARRRSFKVACENKPRPPSPCTRVEGGGEGLRASSNSGKMRNTDQTNSQMKERRLWSSICEILVICVLFRFRGLPTLPRTGERGSDERASR